MECLSSNTYEYILLEIEEGDITTYYRRDTDAENVGDGWEQQVGESWESLYDVPEEFEEIYQRELNG